MRATLRTKQWHGREAPEASWAWNLTKSLIQTSLFWTVFLILIPAGIRVLERACGWHHLPLLSHNLQLIVGTLLLFFSALGLSSCYSMAVWGHGTPLPADCTRQLVTIGPYRYVRNPMAIAGPMQAVMIGLLIGSLFTVFYAITGMLLWNLWMRPWEEDDLENRFGAAYVHYRTHVRCWIPRLVGYRASE